MNRTHKRCLPKLGMRTVKTAICVLICLLINYFFSPEVGLISAIAAIVCMQSTIENTLKTSLNRLVGTAIGGIFGMLLLPLAEGSPFDFLYVLLMPLGIIVIIYLCNLIKMPGSAVICAIVYISVLVAPATAGSIKDPYLLAVFRIIDTVIGIVVAMLVNRFIAPPKRYETRKVHLICDTYESIYERVRHRLTGTEQLILYDTALTTDCADKQKAPSAPLCEASLRIPVPTEYKKDRYIEAAYITADYTVTPIHLKQTDGYIEIPCETYPSTVVWQSFAQESALFTLLGK